MEPGTPLDWFTDFYVREDSNTIKTSLRNPQIRIRAGLIEQDNISLIPVMFWLGKHPNQLFETWWNYHATADFGKKCMETMAEQTNIAFHLYGDKGLLDKSILLPRNPLQEFFKQSLEKLKNTPEWSMDEFDNARDKIYQEYQPMDLWELIK
jgi:hypothetical protein